MTLYSDSQHLGHHMSKPRQLEAPETPGARQMANMRADRGQGWQQGASQVGVGSD